MAKKKELEPTNEIKFGRPWVDTSPTTGRSPRLLKGEIINEVYELTGISKGTIKDILDAFTDVAQKEMVMHGTFNWPGLPTVIRSERKGIKRYFPDIDKTLLFPKTGFLRAKMPIPVRKMLRAVYREQWKAEYGTTDENWWEPFVYCDGDWRLADKKDKK